MLSEEQLERVEFLGHAFDVVQAINADNDLHAAEALLELGDAVLYGFPFYILSGRFCGQRIFLLHRGAADVRR